MDLTPNTLTKIEQYLNDTMSIIDKNAFEIEINQSNEIKEFIEIQQQIDQFGNNDNWVDYQGDTEHLKKTAQLFQQKEVLDFSNKLKSIRKEQKPEKKLWQWKKLLLANGLVACFVAFIYMSYFQQANLSSIYNDNNSWNELPSLTVKGTSLENNLSNIESLFKEKKFNECSKLCLSIINDSKTFKPTILLYLGISQLELNENENALKTFTLLTKSNTIDFHKGYWYKAMVYLKQDKKELFINELKLIKKHQYYRNEEVNKILSDLKVK